MSNDFTLESYEALIRDLLHRGYEPVEFESADPAARHLILRHDIDMSIEAARRLAEVETDIGVVATYFVLLGTELYNPWSDQGRRQLDVIAGLGHEIGLHLDAGLYPDNWGTLEAAAEEECSVLEALVGKPVRTISFHRPAETLIGRIGKLAGRRHAYEPRYFSEMGYCSDSRGAWQHGAPLDHSAIAAGTALQLLTHPIWWVGEAATPKERLRQFLSTREAMLDRALAENCAVHQPRTGADI
jgi:peptidoglycan/xylan/chitin deacetylase (PgdA/CDA1 family)